jgi:outer membrane immunogenic protein
MNVSKGFLLATAGGVAAATGAQAADLPMKSAGVAPMSVFAPNWSGWYVGGNIGGAWQSVHVGYNDFEDGGGNFTSPSFIGGLQIGQNWQSGNLVLGWEADISGLTKGPRVEANEIGKGNSLESHLKWLATFRARGGIASDNILIYVTGGLAVGSVKNTYAPNGLAASSLASEVVKSATKTQVGWTVGGGLEYMWTRNWTIGIEGLYVSLPSYTARTVDGDKKAHFKNDAVIARLKMNYKF